MTILYILIVYSIGLTSFKLIDLIPDGIIRWIGVGVSSWGGSDNADDILYQLDDKMAQQTVNMTMRLQSATQGIYGAAAGWGIKAERAAAVESAQKAAAEKAVQQRAAAEAAATKPPEKN
jgi:hypothetical protein